MRAAFDAYNATARELGLPEARKLDDQRKTKLRARLREIGGLGGWRRALDALRASPHCRGENDRGWRADLDFLLSPSRLRRLLEGSYTPKPPGNTPGKLVLELSPRAQSYGGAAVLPTTPGNDHRFDGLPGVQWRARDQPPGFGPEIGGIYLDVAWEAAAEAAGMDAMRPPDLRPLAEWLGLGIDGTAIARAIRRVRQRNPSLRVHALAYFDAAVREESGVSRFVPAPHESEEALA